MSIKESQISKGAAAAVKMIEEISS